MKPVGRKIKGAVFVVSAICVATLISAYPWKTLPVTGNPIVAEQSSTKLPEIIRPGGKPSDIKPVPAPSNTDSILPSGIQIIDGDTIRIDGTTYRLVGFDTPEMGNGARCARERDLAERATNRLRQIVSGGNLGFQRIACSC